MDEGTKKALMVGVPVGLALLAGAIYFATRPAQGGNGVPPPPPPGCQEGTVMLETCPDGSQITSHQCINGVWVPTGLACAVPPPVECSPESYPHTFQCGDGTNITLRSCVGGRWVPGTEPCPGYPPYPTMPGLPCSGDYASYCDFDKYGFNRQYQCVYGRWFPIHGHTTKTHPYGSCNQGTGNYIHLYFDKTFPGDYCILVKWWDQVDNRINVTPGYICDYQTLIDGLNYWAGQGKINQVQYNNAITQFNHMWPQRPPPGPRG